MAWRFTSDKPVYLQIAERISRSVMSGTYAPGQQIPPVRQLAMEAAVNPNTVQHAFTELENAGIILSKGTMGRFVTEDTQVLEACCQAMARELTERFVEEMAQLSISPEQAIQFIREVSQ